MRGQFRILIVDDEDNFLRSISRMLQDKSFSTDTASNNEQALNRFRQIPYDMVIVDMNMPDFDGEPNKLAGIKLVERLREIDVTLPTIILTGEDDATIRTMLAAKKLQHIDIFLKNLSSGDELVHKIDQLLKESEITLLAAGVAEPVSFKRTAILNLQGVVSRIDGDSGQVFIIEREGVLPRLIGHYWLAKAGYGQLREEPVDIIGVQANRFVVTGTDNIVFLRDFYRNNILAHKKDLQNLVGEIVDVNEQLKRHGVQITSGHTPEYLASKRYWQAITDADSLLPMYSEVDILGERDGKLRIRLHQTLILDENGVEAEVTEAHVSGLLGKVVTPIDEDDQGTLQIISDQTPDVLGGARWQATTSDEMIFIAGERVEVVGIKDKKLLVAEVIEEG